MSFGGITRWSGIVAIPLAKLSMVAKGSFLDLGPAVNVAQYADGEHVVWLTDSAGKVAQANLDRPGTGETLGAKSSLKEHPKKLRIMTNRIRGII